MSFSLNEAEATARKAARGVGYPWGLADEAGKAVRWLCANGVDGVGALARLLQQVDGVPLERLAPDPDCVGWTASDRFLCPLMTGCALADHGLHSAQITNVAAPVLLLPFLAMVARKDDLVVQLSVVDGRAATNGGALSMQDQLLPQGDVGVEPAHDFGTPNARTSRATPDPRDWTILNDFAHRTYAPATEESRLKGAG